MANLDTSNNAVASHGRYGRTYVSDTTAHTPANATYVYAWFVPTTAGTVTLCTEGGAGTIVGDLSDLSDTGTSPIPLQKCTAFTAGTARGVLIHEPA